MDGTDEKSITRTITRLKSNVQFKYWWTYGPDTMSGHVAHLLFTLRLFVQLFKGKVVRFGWYYNYKDHIKFKFWLWSCSAVCLTVSCSNWNWNIFSCAPCTCIDSDIVKTVIQIFLTKLYLTKLYYNLKYCGFQTLIFKVPGNAVFKQMFMQMWTPLTHAWVQCPSSSQTAPMYYVL